MSSLFITGASGFVAGSLLQKIDIRKYRNVYCLSRTESDVTKSLSSNDNFVFIKGSIYDSDLYKTYLTSTDIVVHLAAVMGKKRPDEYFSVNAKGTEYFIKQCEQSGVKSFLYISSIASKFSNISNYYYAQSKQQGEEAVRKSKLNYTILRPTIIVGNGSGSWESLSRLAKAPVSVIFGDGLTKIQPIYIEDLLGCILSVINDDIFMNETFDLGGPEVITLDNFIRQIHRIYYKKEPRMVHIPLRPLISVISLAEKGLFSLLPFTAGQLSSFSNDGTIETNRLLDQHLPHMKNINEMLRLALNDG